MHPLFDPFIQSVIHTAVFRGMLRKSGGISVDFLSFLSTRMKTDDALYYINSCNFRTYVLLFLQLINLGITLLDALKTSFSQRSFSARSLGGNDRFSDAAIASISLIKGYAQTYQTKDDVCRQKAICMANQACVSDAPSVNNIWCKLGS
jgi:hypothetical protein